MPLLNYTTSIDPTRSVADIQALLARHGAEEVTLKYRAGQVHAVAFRLPGAFGQSTFVLPARTEAVEQTLKRQRGMGGVTARHCTPEHAARVAWRIVYEWLKVQMAIVETGMVTLDEIMVPFLTDAKGQSVYQIVQAQHRALEAPRNGTGKSPGPGGSVDAEWTHADG